MAVSTFDRDRSVQAEHTATLPAGSGLRLRMHYAPPQTPVLAVSGEVDAATTPRLAELLWSRLQSTLPALVLDLSEVSFLGLDGVTLLAAVERYARYRGIAVRLVIRTRAVDRALHAGGLTDTLPRFGTAAAAAELGPVTPVVPTPRKPNRLRAPEGFGYVPPRLPGLVHAVTTRRQALNHRCAPRSGRNWRGVVAGAVLR